MRDRIFHRVTYDRLQDWLRCGWMIARANAPVHHNDHGVMVEWCCDCMMVRPR